MTRLELLNIIFKLKEMGFDIDVEAKIKSLNWMMEYPNDRMITFYNKNIRLEYTKNKGLLLSTRMLGDITDEYIEELNVLYKFHRDIVSKDKTNILDIPSNQIERLRKEYKRNGLKRIK